VYPWGYLYMDGRKIALNKILRNKGMMVRKGFMCFRKKCSGEVL
jgi:hypothetical protein